MARNGVIVLESCLYGSNSSFHKRQLFVKLSDYQVLEKDSSAYSSLSYTFISKEDLVGVCI